MAAYRRVYDSRHLQADCQEPGSTLEPYARTRVWATYTVSTITTVIACLRPALRLGGLFVGCVFWLNM